MKTKDQRLIILSFISIYLIWGSTYMFNKMLVAELKPFLLGSIRFTTAGVVVVVLSYFFAKNQKTSKQQLINCAIAGFLFLTTGNGIAVWALQFIDSGIVALLISAQPLVLILMMRILEGKKIKLKSMVGIAMGILGIYLLVSQDGLDGQSGKWQGYLAILSCLFFWGYGSLFVAKADLPSNSLIGTGYQMLFGGLMMLGMSFFLQEDISAVASLSKQGVLSMIYLVIFGSIVAFTAFNYLLKRVSPEKVATSTYINPIVAMTLGVWWLNETITWVSILAAVVLLCGVWFINSAKTESLKETIAISEK